MTFKCEIQVSDAYWLYVKLNIDSGADAEVRENCVLTNEQQRATPLVVKKTLFLQKSMTKMTQNFSPDL